MRAYVWTILILLLLESFGRALWISKGEYPRRTPGVVVFDLIAGLLLAAWAAFLLLTEASHG